MTPDPKRATAERLAREEQWNPSDEDIIDRFKACAFGDVESLREWLIKAQPHDVGRVREELVRFARHLLTWDRLEHRAVSRRLTHRDRTAEREAARKAWDAACESVRASRLYEHDIMGPNGPHWGNMALAEIRKERDRYLAAEFDAGERVIRCALCQQDGADISTGTHTTRDECIEALGKRLAEQRGAER